MAKIIEQIKKIFTMKTQPLHNLDLEGNYSGNESTQQAFVGGVYKEGTVQADTSDNLVGLIVPLSSSGMKYALCFNTIPTGNYDSRIRDFLNQFQTQVGGFINYFQIRFYGAHTHRLHTPESLRVLQNTKPILQELVTELGFVCVHFNDRFGEKNKLTNIVYDVSKNRDLSCNQPGWLSIGGVPLYLPTRI